VPIWFPNAQLLTTNSLGLLAVGVNMDLGGSGLLTTHIECDQNISNSTLYLPKLGQLGVGGFFKSTIFKGTTMVSPLPHTNKMQDIETALRSCIISNLTHQTHCASFDKHKIPIFLGISFLCSHPVSSIDKQLQPCHNHLPRRPISG
jgi:hypothetical protein